MRFGPVPLDAAEGAITAHSLKTACGAIKKGAILSAEQIAALRAEGVNEIVAAVLEAGDLHENEAALRVAELLRGDNVRLDTAATGRCNLYATEPGLLVVSRAEIDALNRIHPGLTIATLPEFAPVEAGRMVATVKIIPFALPGRAVATASRLAVTPALNVARWRPMKVALVASTLPGLKPSTMDKTRRVLEDRLKRTGATIVDERRVAHAVADVADALSSVRRNGADLVIAFGASAITDEADVIPAALRRAGGCVQHLGMPVDPGNLLLLGDLDGVRVLGAPGCARSPAENGFDWVLNRLLAGIAVTPSDITGLGVGGLLMEIVSRPQPRERSAEARAPVAAIVLAAGQSSRMGGPNKLLARFDGEPLIRRVVQAALASTARPLVVVTGYREAAIIDALQGLAVEFAHNADYADGLATSLKAGLAKVPAAAAGAFIILADMPGMSGELLDRLIERFHASNDAAIILPTMEGKRGNPVLWPRAYFGELLSVTGDTGARHLLGTHDDVVERVEVGAVAALDVDTPEALAAAGGVLA